MTVSMCRGAWAVVLAAHVVACEYATGIADLEGEPAGYPDEDSDADGGSRPSGSGGSPASGGSAAGGAQSNGGSAPGGSEICAPSSGDDACDRCVKSNCCAEVVGFLSDPAAESFLSCVEPCLTTTCFDSCSAVYPSAGARFAVFGTCLTSRCSTSCG
jgi:hypothetical protein